MRQFEDERTKNIRNKIGNEALNIVLIVLMISIFYKSFVLDLSFKNYSFDLYLIIGIVAFVITRSILLGVDIFRTSKAKSFKRSLIVSIVVTIVNGITNYLKYGQFYQGKNIWLFIAMLVVTFISCFTFIYVIYISMEKINDIKQNRIQRKLDEQENKL